RDGKRVLLASPERALWVYDLEARELSRLSTDDAIADAAFVPDHPSLVATAGDRNEVQFRDLASYRPVAQSGGRPLRTRRDLNTVAFAGDSGLTIAGGDDDRVHVYRGMLGERAEELASFDLGSNVEDIACCSGPRFAVGTSSGRVEWFEGTQRVRGLGPLVPALLGDPIRLALDRDAVVAAFFGQLFRWDGGSELVALPSAPGDIVLEDAADEDVLIAMRIGVNIAIHRATGASRPEVVTEELGKLPWLEAHRVLRAAGGRRAILGRDREGVQVAFIDSDGLTTTVGPGMELSKALDARALDSGLFALWDDRGMVYELDIPAKTWRVIGRVASPGHGMWVTRHPRRGYEVR
ncbi:MAG: hypothetical protein H5U40_11175, partial [Polyangiaceae bacterium]|nr:hypothetical protein [Polyangiaceae bacterium]